MYRAERGKFLRSGDDLPPSSPLPPGEQAWTHRVSLRGSEYLRLSAFICGFTHPFDAPDGKIEAQVNEITAGGEVFCG
jgi:hypothetical protein